MPTRHKWNNIETGYIRAITSIIIILFGAMRFLSLNFKHLHLPSLGKCFHSHPETFCNIAEKMVENNELWERLPDRIFVKADIAKVARLLPKGRYYYDDSEIPKERIRIRLRNLVSACR